MKLLTVNNGTFKLDGGAMFGIVPKSLWNKEAIADSNNMVKWAMRCLLIIDGDKKILVDTAIGNKQSEKFFSRYYLSGNTFIVDNLLELGVTKEEITDVIITHFHFDHCGGAVVRENDVLIPTFPNATYWTNKKQLEWSLNPNGKEEASFLKENIKPLVENESFMFLGEGYSPFKNMSFKLVSGHTESQLLPLINYEGRKIVFVADLFPSVQHLSIPWVMAFDTRPLLTLKEKEMFLQQAIEEDLILFFEHDVHNECCTVKLENGKYKVKEIFKLIDL